MSIGIEISEKNKDVKIAKDFEKIYSSDTSTMRIIKQGNFSSFSDGSDTTICNHNLGYYPAFLLFTPDPRFIEDAWAPNASSIYRMDKNKLKYYGATGETSDNTGGYYVIFDYDLESTPQKSYTHSAANIITSEKIAQRQNIVVRVSESGKNVKTIDFKDAEFSSELKTLLIHQTGNNSYAGGAPWNYVHVKHGLKYAPVTLFYVRNLQGDDTYQIVMHATEDFLLVINSKELAFGYGYFDTHYSYIMLKDPTWE
jgi:hypothetical protein